MSVIDPASITDPDQAYDMIWDVDPREAGILARTILDSGEGELIVSLAIQIASHGLDADDVTLKQCEQAVVDTGEGEWMYDFATSVPGADADRLSWETGRTGQSSWIHAFEHIGDEPEDEDWW